MASKLGTLTLDLVAKIGNYTAPLSKAEQQTKATTQRISADMNKASAAVDLLGTSARKTSQLLGSLVATAGIGFSISELIKYSDTYTGLNNRLKLVTTSETQLATAVKDTFEIAQKSRSSWETTATIYQRFAQNADRLGLSQERVANITETVSKAVAISGATTESANAAMMQFGQALASGVLRGEEFNSVNEQTPAVLDALAKGLGVPRAALKNMAEEGKLTTDVLIKALEKADQSVQDLFGKTDVTIGQSFTYLNNEITKFVGESGKGSGAATALSSSVMVLANNLDLLTNAAMVGGAYLAGTYIPSIYASSLAVAAKTKELVAQTATQYSSIQAERVAAAQELLNTQAQVASTQATLSAIAAEKALETQRLKAQISEKGRTATLTRMAELKKIEAQVTRELAAAEGLLAAAQARSATAVSASVGLGARLLGVLGGPVGLGLTVASVAAGYLLMRGNGDQANKMLGEQSRYAGLATEELGKLSGAQLKAAELELSKELTVQSGHLQKAKNDFEALTESVLDSNKGNQEAYRIWAELRTGVITTEQAFNKLNQAKFVTPDQINALTDSRSKVIQYEDSTKKLNLQLDKTRESGANAALGIRAVSKEAESGRVSVEAFQKAVNKLSDQRTDSQYVMNTAKNLGGDIEKAKALLEYRKQLGLGSVGRQLTPQERKPFEDSYAALRALKAYEDNIAESKKTSLKLSKQQTSEYEKQAREASRIKEEQFQNREDIYYKYATREMKIEKDLQNEIARIQKSNFNPKDTAGYISNAQSRSGLEILLYKAQLDAELNDWKDTEQEKLNRKVYINELMIQLDSDMNEEQKKMAIQSLIGRSNQELAWMKLQKQQRINDASESFRTDMQNIAARYAFEREQILINKSIGEDERKALLNASVFSQNMDESQVRDNTISDYRDVMGFDESPLVRQFEVLQEMRDLDLLNEEAYQKSKLDLTLKYGSSYVESMLGGFASLVDENSKTYAVLFAAQKAFAVAQAMLNIPQAYSKAYDAVVGTPYIGPYIAPAVGAAAAALQVAQAAQIRSVNLTGMAHDGIASIPEEGTWLLNKGERVLNPQDNKAFTDFINGQSNGEPNITINNNTGANVSASRGVDGRVYVTIDEVDQLVAQSLSHPSSKTSKAMNQFTNAGRRR